MNYVEAVVLGIVQGLTEFLPISSTAHLRVVPQIFGWPDPGAAFTAVIQLGTMAAVLLFFWRDLVRIAVAWVRSLFTPSLRGGLDARMGWYIILGTVPIAVFGLLFKDQIETGARDLRIIGWVLILFGVILWLVDRVAPQTKDVEDLSLRDGLLFGLAQSFALIPGVSRSGSTITAGRALSYSREAAARFSFLLSIPAVVLSGLFEARKLGDAGGPQWGPTIVATLVAFVVGYAAIAWLLRWLASHSMLVFAVYRVVVGVLILALVYGGIWSAT
ncbi:MAG: undecaprenyl-diphosphate phosphatase [Candidatus Nanopelagicales bacterium]